MNISTSLLFDRATENMGALQNKLATTQAQLAASKQILSPSDSPDQAAAIQRLRGEIDKQANHKTNLQVALRHYSTEESALKSSSDILVRIKELAIQAANDTQGADSRKAISAEMKALRDQLLSLGNTRDDNGNYIFSGTRVKTQAFATGADGQVTYQGDQTQTRIPAGIERTVSFTRSGTDVFSRVVRTDEKGQPQSVGFFNALDQMISAVDKSQTSGIQQSISDVDQMQSNLTLSLAQSGSDQNIVQSQMDVMDETSLRLKSSLSDVEDLDYASAVTNMNKQMMALQAAMGSFSKISSLTLFDYIQK
jgi:flagellar hook-associated protein 3 FlgL